jgi:hypothetical protein
VLRPERRPARKWKVGWALAVTWSWGFRFCGAEWERPCDIIGWGGPWIEWKGGFCIFVGIGDGCTRM